MFRSCALLCLLLAVLLAVPPTARAAGDLFATTTTYEVVGGTARINIDTPYSSTIDAYQIHSDAVVRDYSNRWVFIINRLFADNILVLDRDSGYGVVTQYSVSGTGLNPRDIHVEPAGGPGSGPGRAFIPLYESNSLLVCDALSGANASTIDLSVFADADGLCEMDRVLEGPASSAHPDGLLFVSIQNQDRSGSSWVPTDAARLAVIDIATESLVDADPIAPGINGIDLQLKNPTWRLEFAVVNGAWRILVNCAGLYGVQDGGIEIINPHTLQSEGVYFSESQLGGDILDFALLGSDIGWAIRSNPNFQTELVQFNPGTGAVTQVALTSAGFDLSDLEISNDARLFVSDRNPGNPGVRIYDSMTGMLLAGPLNTGLPPFDITLLDEVPVSAPAQRLSQRLSASPNPFNPRVEIRLDPVATGSGLELEIVDLRGRLVARLRGNVDGEGVRWVWNGTSREGGSVASGTYFGRVVGVEVAPVKITLVR